MQHFRLVSIETERGPINAADLHTYINGVWSGGTVIFHYQCEPDLPLLEDAKVVRSTAVVLPLAEEERDA